MRNTTLSRVLSMSLLALSPLCYSLPENHNALQFQVVQAQAMFDKSKIESVTVVKTNDHRYSLDIKLTPGATDEMKQLTHDGIGKTMNTVFEGKIISSATIQSELGGSFQLDGFTTKSEAEKAARVLSKSK